MDTHSPRAGYALRATDSPAAAVVKADLVTAACPDFSTTAYKHSKGDRTMLPMNKRERELFRFGQLLATRAWAQASPAQQADAVRRWKAAVAAQYHFIDWVRDILRTYGVAYSVNIPEPSLCEGIDLQLGELVMGA